MDRPGYVSITSSVWCGGVAAATATTAAKTPESLSSSHGSVHVYKLVLPGGSFLRAYISGWWSCVVGSLRSVTPCSFINKDFFVNTIPKGSFRCI